MKCLTGIFLIPVDYLVDLKKTNKETVSNSLSKLVTRCIPVVCSLMVCNAAGTNLPTLNICLTIGLSLYLCLFISLATFLMHSFVIQFQIYRFAVTFIDIKSKIIILLLN